MQVKCDFCDNFLAETEEKCPYCGAPNNRVARAANHIPRTIGELQEFCRVQNLDLKRMHFHIGEDYRGPKAFGIYAHDGLFTVYKNKSDGSRAIRYEGKDEAYAVNEIYQKMKVELLEVREYALKNAEARKAIGSNKTSTYRKPGLFGGRFADFADFIGTVLAVLVVASPFIGAGAMAIYDAFNPEPERGYYQYEDDTYYYGHTGWFVYDEDDEAWERTDAPAGLWEDHEDYWQSAGYDEDFGAPSFSGSDYWDEDNNWDSNWDDDFWSWGSSGGSDWDDDWDSGWGSWDSGNDWDSDW